MSTQKPGPPHFVSLAIFPRGTIRAAGRVLLRVIAKSAAYGSVIAVAVWAISRIPAVMLGGFAVVWALLAVWAFCEKVREEAQRIRGRS